MDITLSISAGPDGRLTGLARCNEPGHQQVLPFSGNLELLAALERICAAAQSDHTPPSDPGSTVTEQEH